ncbi:hypothetical protein OROGR_003918 [Orobanche gracilis]
MVRQFGVLQSLYFQQACNCRMSSQDEDGMSLDKGSDNSGVVLMKPKLSYSRELLLSLSNLDSCKRFPSGFDESLKSEFEDALMRIPDRPRILGSLPFHGFRRNEFGASPPTRVDADTYSKGNYGKWESRSSMWGDRDRDSQSDKDSVLLLELNLIAVVLLICLTKVAKSAFDKALVEHEDIDDVVGSEEPTERDHGVDLQQPLLIEIYSSDNHQK